MLVLHRIQSIVRSLTSAGSMSECCRRIFAYLYGASRVTRTAAAHKKFDDLTLGGDDAFAAAAAAVKDLNSLPTGLRLRIYGLYKQATIGDAPVAAPSTSVLDPAAAYKYRAWAALRGMAMAAARDQYVHTVRRAASDDLDDETVGGDDDDIEDLPQDIDAAMGSMAGPVQSAMATSAEEAEELDQADRRLPLHAAARQGDHKRCVSLLASGECPVDERDEDDHTALHWAADCGSVECVRSLIGKGALIDAQNVDGSSPLHMACACEHEAVAVMLLQHGASRELLDHDGCSPLSLGLAALGSF